jgi:hypothetical protein
MPELQLPPSWDGSMVLEIGGEVGALVLRTPPALDGREIDLVPEDHTVATTHSAVRERRLSHGLAYAAVYPNLRRGTYRIEETGQRVTIQGGRVTELHIEIEPFDLVARPLHTHAHLPQ